MKILGIDPGTTRIGYGLVEEIKSESKLLTSGVIEIKAPNDLEKLSLLGIELTKLLNTITPDIVGVEKLFFSKNQKTALSVSQARGVILFLLMKKNLPIYELRPGEIKQSLTGYALADKEMVARMASRILSIPKIDGYDDASDAVAIALATANIHRFSEKTRMV